MSRADSSGAPIPLTWPRVQAFRMARHFLLLRAPPGSVVDVVGATCGIQAQLMSAAELALRVRVRGLEPQDVRRALWQDRTLVKTWFVRGAVHLIPSADLGTFLGALQAREPRMLGWLQSNGLSRREAEAIVDAVLARLRGGPCTRRALAEQVGRRLGAKARGWVASSWGGVLRLACARGLVCFGPDEGNEVSFVRVEDWLPGMQRPEPGVAATALLRRYLAAFGPATVADYVLWTNLPAGDVRRAWQGVEDNLARTDTERRPGFVLREDRGKLVRARLPGSVVRLLPHFDVFLLAHRDKGHLVDTAHYKRVYRKAGWISSAVLVNGRIEGVWSLERKARGAVVRAEMFAKLSGALREGLASEVEDLERFLNTPCDLVVT